MKIILCFSDFSRSADIETTKAASELISDSISGKLFSGTSSIWLSLCLTSFFPSVCFTGGQGELGSSSNLYFVIISIACYSGTYQHSHQSFTDRGVRFLGLLASFFIEILLLLYWHDRERFPALTQLWDKQICLVIYTCAWNSTKQVSELLLTAW